MTSNNKQLPIKVVFIGRVPWGGGAERVVLDIARNMDPQRFEPVILCLYAGPCPPSILAKGVEIRNLLPTTFNSFFKAIVKGVLRSDDLLKKDLWCEFKENSLPFRAYRRLRGIAHTHLLAFVRRLWWAANSGKATPFLAERIYRRLGVEYSGERIVVCLGAPKAFPSPKDVTEDLEPADEAKLKAEEEPDKTLPDKTASVSHYLTRRPIDMRRQARLIASYVASLRGPVVVIASMEEAASATCLGLGSRPYAAKPFILQTHAWESYYLPIMYGNSSFEVGEEKTLFAAACLGAEVVTSPSHGCRDDLVEGFNSPPDRTICLPNPVNLDFIRQQSLLEPEKPLKGYDPELPLLLCSSRLDPQKGHLLLFDACRLLRDRGINFNLACLGEGSLRSKLERKIKESDLDSCVHLEGFIKNPFPYYRTAKANLLASESESFALVLVESLACGCLPISFDCPHGPRDVLDGGKAGLLVKSFTPEALADAIELALTNDQLVKEKIEYGRKWIKQYDIKSIVPHWENLVSHLAGEYCQLF